MSQRRPYPFDAIETKWRETWTGAGTAAQASLGRVPSPTLQSAWLRCLESRSLKTGFPGAIEASAILETAGREFGLDAVRLAQLSLPGDSPSQLPGSEQLGGACRFLGRVWRLYVDERDAVDFEQACTVAPSQWLTALNRIRLSPALHPEPPSAHELKAWHSCLQRVEQGIAQQRPHIAVAALTEFVNQAMVWQLRPSATMADACVVLQPFAPLLALELGTKLSSTLALELPQGAEQLDGWTWPVLDSKLLTETGLEILIQINGRLRDKLFVSVDLSAAELEKAALSAEKIIPYLKGKIIRKVVVIPQQLVNIAVE